MTSVVIVFWRDAAHIGYIRVTVSSLRWINLPISGRMVYTFIVASLAFAMGYRVLIGLFEALVALSFLLDIVFELHLAHMDKLVPDFVVQIEYLFDVFFFFELYETEASGFFGVEIIDDVGIAKLTEGAEVLC